jgi:two-component system, NtrC family, response regulator HydG
VASGSPGAAAPRARFAAGGRRQACGFEQVISRSARMRPVFERALAASRSQTPVLITGETGTGKELIARAIHANSRRAARAFVPLNCAALPAELVESELFGHRRGAFSGALHDHPGLFVAADGGTLLLDEIGELPLETQAKLLRVLQDGEVRAVGALESRRVDVRIVAATNRPLAWMRDHGLRPDLFYRLSVLVIDLPPLRERGDDLPLLVGHILSRLRAAGASRVERLDPAALDWLATYPFPGNVRELENLLEGAAVSLAADRTVITVEDVRERLQPERRGRPAAEREPAMPLNLGALAAWAIHEAMRRTGGNKRQAALMLGISRDTLYRKLHELDAAGDVSDPLT